MIFDNETIDKRDILYVIKICKKEDFDKWKENKVYLTPSGTFTMKEKRDEKYKKEVTRRAFEYVEGKYIYHKKEYTIEEFNNFTDSDFKNFAEELTDEDYEKFNLKPEAFILADIPMTFEEYFPKDCFSFYGKETMENGEEIVSFGYFYVRDKELMYLP